MNAKEQTAGCIPVEEESLRKNGCVLQRHSFITFQMCLVKLSQTIVPSCMNSTKQWKLPVGNITKLSRSLVFPFFLADPDLPYTTNNRIWKLLVQWYLQIHLMHCIVDIT